jgi:4'-phosphopantetheinyl transferase
MTAAITRLARYNDVPADIDVWRIAVPSDAAALLPMRRLLDDAELQRADRYRQPADRARFVAARHALRILLAQRTGEPAHALRFVHNPYGKPALDGLCGVTFNVSHSGDQALIALSAGRALGVDIERIDQRFNWRDVAGIALNSGEQRAIEALPAAAQMLAFLRCWTAKEALLKASGFGIAVADGLRATRVDPLAEGAQAALTHPPGLPRQSLRFRWLDSPAGYVGCIAWEMDDIARGG